MYVVEDTQTSYWPGFGGSSQPPPGQPTTMAYFKTLADGLNHKEIIKPGYIPSYFDEHINSITFYHTMVFVLKGKGDNTERSSALFNNCTDEAWILGEESKAVAEVKR